MAIRPADQTPQGHDGLSVKMPPIELSAGGVGLKNVLKTLVWRNGKIVRRKQHEKIT
jgi:hypothetical protein